MAKQQRRKFIIQFILALGANLPIPFVKANKKPALLPTPSEAEGPFYPVHTQSDKDFDLTQYNESASTAVGNEIVIAGRVLNIYAEPIANATIDLWQANAAGKYRHPRDPNPAAEDAYFQGWAILQTDANGNFTIKTVYPGAYPVGAGWVRPPHVHLKVRKQGFKPLTTQFYFEGDALNKKDLLLLSKTPTEQAAMIAKKTAVNNYTYTVVLSQR